MRSGPACPIHGHWVCGSCGWTRRNANRLYSGVHQCHRCGSTQGYWVDAGHNSPTRTQDCIEFAESLATKKPLCDDGPTPEINPEETQ